MPERLYRIGDAAEMLGLKTYVLRYWETEFPALRPVRSGKGQRRYTESDVELLGRIRYLLHEQGMTIEGARRVLSGDSALSLVTSPAHSTQNPALSESSRQQPAPQAPASNEKSEQAKAIELTELTGSVDSHDKTGPVQLSLDFRVLPMVGHEGGFKQAPVAASAQYAEQTISKVAAELRELQRLLRTPTDVT